MQRVIEQLVAIRQLDDAAEIHHGYALTEMPHHREIVGDEQVSEAEALAQILEQVDDLRLDRHVERGHGLVADDEFGLERERARDPDPLALALDPEFIICDEAVSALDVSIQAQIVNLLEDLRARFGLTYLFIAHDLSVVRHRCQRVAVMYLGRIVELADCDELFDNALHPYTRALLDAVPVPDPSVEADRKFKPVKGEVPSPINPPSGCVFHPRCPIAVESCSRMRPELREVRTGHWVACSEVR